MHVRLAFNALAAPGFHLYDEQGYYASCFHVSGIIAQLSDALCTQRRATGFWWIKAPPDKVLWP